MPIRHIKQFFFVAILMVSCGCAVISGKVATDYQTAGPSQPENNYYYFTKSQLEVTRGNIDKAIWYLDKAIKADPESLYLKRELALLYLQRKEYTKGRKLISDILEQDPDHTNSLIVLGNIQQILNQPTGAIKTYEKVIANDPEQESILLLLAELYWNQNDLENAFATYQTLVEHFPASYAGYYYLGKIYALQNNVSEAEKHFKKTLLLQPNLTEPRYQLIDIYKAGKDPDKDQKIMQAYQDILKTYPGNIRATMGLALHYYRIGMTEKSEELFQGLGARSLSNKDIIRIIIQLYIDEKQYADAVVLLKSMIHESPDDPYLHYLIAIAYDGMHNQEETIRHFKMIKPDSTFYSNAVTHIAFLYWKQDEKEEAMALLEDAALRTSDNMDIILYLVSLYEETEQYQKAETFMLRSLENDPENTQLMYGLGVVYDKQDKKESAIDQMKAVISISPKDADALNYLGYTYAELGRNLDEAETLIKEALKYKPGDGYITDSLGWVYFKKGFFEEAVEVLEEAVSIIPDDPIILEHLGDAYLKTANTSKALECYHRALKEKEKNKEDLENKIKALIE